MIHVGGKVRKFVKRVISKVVWSLIHKWITFEELGYSETLDQRDNPLIDLRPNSGEKISTKSSKMTNPLFFNKNGLSESLVS